MESQHIRWRAATAPDWEAARTLIRAYAEELAIDACFRRLDAELEELPSRFVDHQAALFLGGRPGHPVATISIHPTGEGCAEISRLYVAPPARGSGLGAALIEGALAFAAAGGFDRVRLHTLPVMAAAVRLYGRLGFRPAAPDDPPAAPGALYFERAVGRG